jgi:hypothetical protein
MKSWKNLQVAMPRDEKMPFMGSEVRPISPEHDGPKAPRSNECTRQCAVNNTPEDLLLMPPPSKRIKLSKTYDSWLGIGPPQFDNDTLARRDFDNLEQDIENSPAYSAAFGHPTMTAQRLGTLNDYFSLPSPGHCVLGIASSPCCARKPKPKMFEIYEDATEVELPSLPLSSQSYTSATDNKENLGFRNGEVDAVLEEGNAATLRSWLSNFNFMNGSRRPHPQERMGGLHDLSGAELPQAEQNREDINDHDVEALLPGYFTF